MFSITKNKWVAVDYKDPVQRKYDQELKQLLIVARNGQGMFKPLSIQLYVGFKMYFAPPKSWTKSQKEQALAGFARPASLDLSNLIKTIEDCGNKVLWADDAQIVEYLPGTGKYYGLPERWEIEIKEA